MLRAKGRDLDLNAKTKKGIHPRKASEELLLTGQQQWAKTKANRRTDGRICTPLPPPPPPLDDDETRREESRGRAGVGLKPRRPSRGGSRPAPAERGRDRHWHWQAGGLVPGRARFGISRGVCCAGGVGAVGRSIAATFRVPTVGRSPAPASAACRTALASFTNFHGHVHASLLPQQYCRPQLVQLDARRSAGVRGKGDRRSCCQCGSARAQVSERALAQFASRSAAVNVK